MLGATALVAQPAFAAPPAARGGGMGDMHFQGGGGGGGGADWWRLHHGGHRGGGWIGPAIGFGAGVAVGSALAAPYYAYDEPPYVYEEPSYTYSQPAYAYNDADAYCAAKFRSYNPATGTYMGYDGLPHPCP